MSTDTAEEITPYIRAAHLNREVFGSIFPDSPEAAKRPGRQNDIPAELRIPEVENTADVEIDDILVVIEDTRYAELRLRTAREIILSQPRTSLVRVIAKSAKSVVVRYIDFPGRGNWRIDLAQFGEVPPHHLRSDTRLMLSSGSRAIGRLGTATELRQKVLDHPQFAEWQAAYNAAEEMFAADEAKSRAERDARTARLAPIKAAVQGLVDVTGERLVNMSWGDAPRGENPWLEAGDFKRVRVYIAGLYAVGDLTKDQHRQALEHLDVIIAAAKGKQ